jgi:phosphoribosyl-AMP cyclohydrolase
LLNGAKAFEFAAVSGNFSGMSYEVEEGGAARLDFSKLQAVVANGCEVIPAIAQDVGNGMVLMLGYVNAVALAEAQRIGRAVFWSTSRNELWIKGATSGDWLELLEIRVNCEQNSLLYLVRPAGGGTCHTRDAAGRHRPTCYYRRLEGDRLIALDAGMDWRALDG